MTSNTFGFIRPGNWMGKSNLYQFRNQHLLKRRYRRTFFPDPPHHPHNHRSNFTDTQEERVITSQNLLPNEQ